MAIIKNIYFQDDVGSKLKELDNVSGLINKLLRDYFKIKDNENISIEERKKELEIKKIELEAMKKI